jgi:hypothetical protein
LIFLHAERLIPDTANISYNVTEDISPVHNRVHAHSGIPMVRNQGYDIPISHATYDYNKKLRTGPRGEAVKHTSRIPNSLHLRPRVTANGLDTRPQHPDIYKTPTPDSDVGELVNNAASNNADSDISSQVEAGTKSGTSITDDLTSGECNEYFPTAAIETMDSPAYNIPNYPAVDTVNQSTAGGTSGPTPEPTAFTSLYRGPKATEPEAQTDPDSS